METTQMGLQPGGGCGWGEEELWVMRAERVGPERLRAGALDRELDEAAVPRLEEV